MIEYICTTKLYHFRKRQASTFMCCFRLVGGVLLVLFILPASIRAAAPHNKNRYNEPAPHVRQNKRNPPKRTSRLQNEQFAAKLKRHYNHDQPVTTYLEPRRQHFRQNARNPNSNTRQADRLENAHFRARLDRYYKYMKQDRAAHHATGAAATTVPTAFPSREPSWSPSPEPTFEPTVSPSLVPTSSQTTVPTIRTTRTKRSQSKEPSWSPSPEPTTLEPSVSPSLVPTQFPPTSSQTALPTITTTRTKRSQSTTVPTTLPPTLDPTMPPSSEPSFTPSSTDEPTIQVSAFPTDMDELIPASNRNQNATESNSTDTDGASGKRRKKRDKQESFLAWLMPAAPTHGHLRGRRV